MDIIFNLFNFKLQDILINEFIIIFFIN